jgi:hypothetical protein
MVGSVERKHLLTELRPFIPSRGRIAYKNFSQTDPTPSNTHNCLPTQAKTLISKLNLDRWEIASASLYIKEFYHSLYGIMVFHRILAVSISPQSLRNCTVTARKYLYCKGVPVF